MVAVTSMSGRCTISRSSPSGRAANRRFPLSVMAVGASIPEGEDWEIVDGNRPDIDVGRRPSQCMSKRDAATADPVRAIAFTVMPGPQLANAVPLTRKVKAQHPDIAIVWGGNFGSLYPAPVLNAPYIDWIVRGQGEQSFAELLDVLKGDARSCRGRGALFTLGPDGSHHLGAEAAPGSA